MAIRDDWKHANKTGNDTADTWRLRQQIAGDKAEREAFHVLMQMITADIKDEVIRLWVQGTEGASAEAYNRRLLADRLSEADYAQSQEIAHEMWLDGLNQRLKVS